MKGRDAATRTERAAKLRRMITSGQWSITQISKATGCNFSTIKATALKLGIEIPQQQGNRSKALIWARYGLIERFDEA